MDIDTVRLTAEDIVLRFIDEAVTQEIRAQVIEEICLDDAGMVFARHRAVVHSDMPSFHYSRALRICADNIIAYFNAEQHDDTGFTRDAVLAAMFNVLDIQIDILRTALYQIDMDTPLRTSGVMTLAVPNMLPVPLRQSTVRLPHR